MLRYRNLVRRIALAVVLCTSWSSLGSTTAARATSVATTPQNPTFTVDRGSVESRIKVLFTPTAGIERYTVRMYTSFDNFDTVAHTQTNYVSGADIGTSGQFTSGCGFDEVCIALQTNRGIKLTIQGFDANGNAVTAESEKSVIHYPANPRQQQFTVTAPPTGSTPTLRIVFTPLAGQSSTSLQLYRSTDNYTEVFRELTGITSVGRVIDVPGNTTYKYRFKTIGSTTNDAVFLSSLWSVDLFGNTTTVSRPNPPANVVITSGNESLTATWDAPQSVPGATINGYLLGISRDGTTWNDVVISASSRSSTRTESPLGTPLVNGQPYWVRLGSQSSNGTANYWTSPTPIRPAFEPYPPERVDVVAGDRRIDVSWSPPNNDGGSPVTGYLVQHSVDGSTWIDNNVTAPTTSFSISNLQNGTQYSVQVSARNNAGLSGPFLPTTATPTGNPVPKTLDVTRIGSTTATFNMQVDTQGGVVTPGFNYGTIGAMSSNAAGQQERGAAVTFSRTITGLTPGFRYEVRATATTDALIPIRHSGSSVTFTTTPSPVTGLFVLRTATTATVTWNQSPTNHSIAHVYQVWAEQSGVEAGNRCTTFTNNGRTCEITGLTPGRTYTILATATAVGASYGNGTSFPSSISVTTLAEQTINFSFATLPKKTTSSATFNVLSYGSSSSGLSLSLTSRTPSVCGINSGMVSIVTSGTCTIRATQNGSSRFGAATPVDASFIVAAPQTITFSISNIGTQTLGGSTLSLAPLASASSNLTVTFTTTTQDNCSISGTTLTYLRAGTCRVVASQAGDDSYEPASNVAQTITVARGAQAPLTVTSTSGTFATKLQLTTSGGSGSGPVSYAIDTNSVSATASGCAIGSGSLISTSAGTCAVIATKAQDDNYTAKTSTSTLVNLGKASQTISFQPIAGSANLIAGQSTSAVAQSTSGLSVTITSDTTSLCTVSGSTITLISDGVCILRGSQTGNSNFLAATQVTESFEISPKPIPDTYPITYTQRFSPNNYRVGDTVELTVAPSTYMGLPVPGTYEFISTMPNSFSFGTPTVDGNGTTRVSVTFQRANNAFQLYAVFTPTDSVTFAQGKTFAAIQVAARTQAIVVNGGTTQKGLNLPVSYSGVQSSGQISIDFSPVTDTNQSVDIADQQARCSISNQSVTRDNPGTCYVRVNSMGDGVHESSMGVRAFVFTRLNQTIILSNENTLESLTAGSAGSSIDLTGIVSSSASLTVAVLSLTTSVCTVANFAVTIVSGGVCSLQLSQAGDSTYLPAETRVYNFSIARLEQSALTLSSTLATFGTPLTLTSSGGSGTGQVTFTAQDGLATGCTIQNGVLTSSTSGTCLITVSKGGDANYLPQTSPISQVEIARASQNLFFSLSSLGSPLPNSSAVNLNNFATTNAPGSIMFSTADSTACRVNGSTLEWVSVGACLVSAVHFGDENYEPASQQVEIAVALNATPPVAPSNSVAPVISPPAAPLARASQSAPRTPKTGKVRRTIKFTMKAPSGLPLTVRGASACRSSKITKTVTTRTKVRGKTVVKKSTVQTGWLVTFTKKGNCTITFQNSGNSEFEPLQATSAIKVS